MVRLCWADRLEGGRARPLRVTGDGFGVGARVGPGNSPSAHTRASSARGVLLLNTTLTVREGVPGSHRGMGWETFTDRVIQEVERASPVFMLWGKEAQKKRRLLENTPPERIIESSLPAPQAARRGPKPFLGSKPFTAPTTHSSNRSIGA